jgi:UMP-CMP kinase
MLDNVKIVFVLGGPASGKRTQMAKLVKEFGFTHLSMGDIMRAEVLKGTNEG